MFVFCLFINAKSGKRPLLSATPPPFNRLFWNRLVVLMLPDEKAQSKWVTLLSRAQGAQK